MHLASLGVPSSFLFLVVRPGALVASLLLVAMPGAPSSFLLPVVLPLLLAYNLLRLILGSFLSAAQ